MIAISYVPDDPRRQGPPRPPPPPRKPPPERGVYGPAIWEMPPFPPIPEPKNEVNP